jgi:cytochrome c oxidase subunit 4
MSYFLTWLALMGFLAATVASSYVAMGPWNTAINMAISCAKALLIALFFMELRHAGALLRIAALAGLLWLALLFGISWSDFATRTIAPAPWSAPR